MEKNQNKKKSTTTNTGCYILHIVFEIRKFINFTSWLQNIDRCL